MKATYTDRLASIREKKQTVLCVGLDPDPGRLPATVLRRSTLAEAVVRFNREIVDSCAPFAAAIKCNFAFFEALGPDGWGALHDSVRDAPDDLLLIADAKRCDIGNSASFYARAILEELPFDAITVSGYMGKDSIEPFLRREGSAAYVLVRTSNPGGADLQELKVDGEPLYVRTARMAVEAGREAAGTVGFVVGATDLTALARIHELFPGVPLLIPGIGAQGGSATDVARICADAPVLINSSRQILYADSGDDFADSAAKIASQLRDTLSIFDHA